MYIVRFRISFSQILLESEFCIRLGEDAHRTFKKRHAFRSNMREPVSRSRDAFATRFAKELPAGPPKEESSRGRKKKKEADSLFNSESDEEYLSALDAEEEAHVGRVNPVPTVTRMLNEGSDAMRKNSSSPHGANALGPALFTRPPPDPVMGRGARMKIRAELLREPQRPGGGGLQQEDHLRLRSSPAPSASDRDVQMRIWKQEAEADKSLPVLAGRMYDHSKYSAPPPPIQAAKRPGGSALLNRLRMKKAAKASSESDSAASVEKRTEDAAAAPKRDPRRRGRAAAASDLFLDQDPRGRAVREVGSVFEIDNLHPALSRLLQEHGVDAPKPLQRGMWPCLARSKSFVAIARQGGGKTVGFLIPLINRKYFGLSFGLKRSLKFCTASLSHLRTMLPESSSWPLPAKRPNHAT